MTQVSATMTFETRRMEESITAAVLDKVGPTIAQVAADLQRLTKLLEAEAVEAAEFAAVLAHSGAVSIEVATAQADSLSRLGYRLVPVPASSAPEPVAATWDGPTPPQAAPAVRTPTGEVPLWTPPPAPASPAVVLGQDLDVMTAKVRRDHPLPGDPPAQDESWKAAFE